MKKIVIWSEYFKAYYRGGLFVDNASEADIFTNSEAINKVMKTFKKYKLKSITL